MSQYLRSVNRHAVLDEETQLKHCKRIADWMKLVELPDPGSLPAPLPPESDPSDLETERLGRRSLNVMTNTNLRMVLKLAHKYKNYGLDIMDLVQEGNLGLIRALLMYDPSKGFRLSTYAYWWIRQNIIRAIHNKSKTIRIPINTYEMHSKIKTFVQEYVQTHAGRYPPIALVAINLGISVERVKEVQELIDLTNTVSLSTFVHDDDSSSNSNSSNLENVLADKSTLSSPFVEDEATLTNEELEQNEELKKLIKHLPYREAYIVEEIYFENRSMQEVAEDLELSQARVRQLLKLTLNKLKAKLIYHRYRANFTAPADF